uniref:Chromo domain-containing protein n=1 Tax=Chenopodium quinoa TaxID=63459 RepID=A0A803L122_CHEQI
DQFRISVPSPSQPNRVRRDSERNLEFCSALQLRSADAKGEPTFLVALVEISPDKSVEVPDKVVRVLDEFKDVMPPELPKNLPPRCVVDHKIDLEPSALPPARAPYRMIPDALSPRSHELVAALTAVESNFTEKEIDQGIERILDHRAIGQEKKNFRREYLVLWKGKSELDATWGKVETLWQHEDCQDLPRKPNGDVRLIWWGRFVTIKDGG